MRPGYAGPRGGRRRQLRLRGRVRRRVPRLPVQLQRRGLPGTGRGSRRQARPPAEERARRRRDGRPGRARRAGRHHGRPQRARPLSRSPLGRALPRRRRVARLLAEEARLPRRLARPAREGGQARGGVRRGGVGVRLPRARRRARPARAAADAELARHAVPRMTRLAVVAGPVYLALLLAVDTRVGRSGQYALGAVTWLVLLCALVPLPPLRRAQALGVVAFATVGE